MSDEADLLRAFIFDHCDHPLCIGAVEALDRLLFTIQSLTVERDAKVAQERRRDRGEAVP